MSTIQVNNRILELQKKLSNREIISATEAIENYSETYKKLELDDRLVYWQMYIQRKNHAKQVIIAFYLFLTLIASLIAFNYPDETKFVQDNRPLTFALWLLIPSLYYLIYEEVMQLNHRRAIKILKAYFPEAVKEETKAEAY